jgi:hypothetical protein
MLNNIAKLHNMPWVYEEWYNRYRNYKESKYTPSGNPTKEGIEQRYHWKCITRYLKPTALDKTVKENKIPHWRLAVKNYCLQGLFKATVLQSCFCFNISMIHLTL